MAKKKAATVRMKHGGGPKKPGGDGGGGPMKPGKPKRKGAKKR